MSLYDEELSYGWPLPTLPLAMWVPLCPDVCSPLQLDAVWALHEPRTTAAVASGSTPTASTSSTVTATASAAHASTTTAVVVANDELETKHSDEEASEPLSPTAVPATETLASPPLPEPVTELPPGIRVPWHEVAVLALKLPLNFSPFYNDVLQWILAAEPKPHGSTACTSASASASQGAAPTGQQAAMPASASTLLSELPLRFPFRLLGLTTTMVNADANFSRFDPNPPMYADETNRVVLIAVAKLVSDRDSMDEYMAHNLRTSYVADLFPSATPADLKALSTFKPTLAELLIPVKLLTHPVVVQPGIRLPKPGHPPFRDCLSWYVEGDEERLAKLSKETLPSMSVFEVRAIGTAAEERCCSPVSVAV